MQIFQSVKEAWTIVVQMQLVQTHLEVTTAVATLALLEMDLHVQVSKRGIPKYALHYRSRNDFIQLHNYLLSCMPLRFLFIDINECEMEIDNCHENATCNNTFGSFECTCIAGFDGDGVECTSKIIGKGPSIHYQYVNKSLPGIF